MEVPRRFIPAFRSAFTFVSSSSPLKRLSTEADILPGEIGEISGVPDKHLRRKVVIYSPARTAMQQGSANTGIWKINFVSTEKWENPLMGWTSTGDPYASLDLCFDSREAAEHFAKKYGWEYTVREPHRPILKPKAYADNYKFKGNIGEEE